jgi:50S ribosomal protein L16 3-hydroxylase
LIEATFRALRHAPPTRTDACNVLLTFLTEPKPNIVFARPRRPVLSPGALRRLARRQGLRLDRRTRMLYSEASIAINGELLDGAGKDRLLMQELADQRTLAPAQLANASPHFWRELAAWHAAGWLHLL